MKLSRDEFVALIGIEVVRFQEESAAFDDVAAKILALDRGDLPCMTVLLFGGPASVDQLIRPKRTKKRHCRDGRPSPARRLCAPTT
jgi:hypothetical protein